MTQGECWKILANDIINKYGYLVCGNHSKKQIGSIEPVLFNGDSREDAINHPFTVIAITDYNEWLKIWLEIYELAKQYGFTECIKVMDGSNCSYDPTYNYYRVITD